MFNSHQAVEILHPFKKAFEDHLQNITGSFQEDNKLTQACAYSLQSGGKRIRPLIVQMVAEALNKKVDVMDAALSVEFFHTASLIADDLPCMDDEKERREKPSVHLVYGESISILSSFTLIALGYEFIYRSSERTKDFPAAYNVSAGELTLYALKKASLAAGISGATNGQFLDLFPPDEREETLEKIIYQKTITLFDIAFSFGWLFGGGDPLLLEEVAKCAYHFGMAFQIADDMHDIASDERKNNMAILMGPDRAFARFRQEMTVFTQLRKRLGLGSQAFTALSDLLKHHIEMAMLPQ